MKTLKLQLLAASMFACTAAFAQGTPNSAPSLGNTPGMNGPAAAVAGANGMSFDNNRSGYQNDAYVLQTGSTGTTRPSQYATVNQTGGGNTADILQGGGYTGTTGEASYGNNASQTQNYKGFGEKNRAYIAQDGTNSTATQVQDGTSNTARAEQLSSSDLNTSYQNQTGDENKAGTRQLGGSRDQAIQFQNGKQNYSTIDQSMGNFNRAETTQMGQNNTAIVMQH